MLHNFAVNICAKVSLTLLFTCVKQCVDLADRLTDVLATISYVTLVSSIKYPKYCKPTIFFLIFLIVHMQQLVVLPENKEKDDFNFSSDWVIIWKWKLVDFQNHIDYFVGTDTTF